MELHPHRIHFRSLILTFFLGICVIVIGIVYRYQEDGHFVPSTIEKTSAVRPTETKKAVTIEKKITTNKGSDPEKSSAQMEQSGERFSLKGNATGKVNDLFTITLMGNSDGSKPVGFDAILSIEGESYDVVSVKSMSSELNIMKFVKNDRVTLTGIIMPKVQNATVWSNNEIATITIKPKTTGEFRFSILESIGRESSKIIVKDQNGDSIKLTSTSSKPLLVDITN